MQNGQTARQMGQTFLMIGKNIAQSKIPFLCMLSNINVYGLLLHLEQISNIHASLDYYWFQAFQVQNFFLLESGLKRGLLVTTGSL